MEHAIPAVGYFSITLQTRRLAPRLGFHGVDGPRLNFAGMAISRSWASLPQRHPRVVLLSWAVTPSMLRGILRVRRPFTASGAPEPSDDAAIVREAIAGFTQETNRVYRLIEGIAEPALWGSVISIRRIPDLDILRTTERFIREKRIRHVPY